MGDLVWQIARVRDPDRQRTGRQNRDEERAGAAGRQGLAADYNRRAGERLSGRGIHDGSVEAAAVAADRGGAGNRVGLVVARVGRVVVKRAWKANPNRESVVGSVIE